MEEQEKLKGVVETVTFRREDTGFTVLELNDGEEMQLVVGVMPNVVPGEELILTGSWTTHPSFGRQFKAELCEQSLPESAGAILKYLASGAVRGIGPSMAEKIVSKFAEKTFDVMENTPEQLACIKGISLSGAKKMGEEFKKQFEIRRVIVQMTALGLTTGEALKVYRLYKAESPEIVRENPYLLCGADIGLSFDRADEIADALDQKPEFKCRANAGVVYILKHNLGNGHTCIPREQILEPAMNLLECGRDDTEIIIDDLISDREIISQTIRSREFLFLPHVYQAEKNAAQRLRIMRQFPPENSEIFKAEIFAFEQSNGIEFDLLQRQAIEAAVEKGMLILTGGPGTGKTTAIRGVISLMKQRGLEVALAAPTGRAAKRMSELTGYEAKTIHRLLEVEYREGDTPCFHHNMENTLDIDCLIVDELSMVDILLFDALLEALPLGCRLIMVGDSDQLPPVGAGNVLSDLIRSGAMPVVKLERIFRQEKESLIIANAHRIVAGEMPILKNRDSDFFFLTENSAFTAAKTMADLYTNRLVKAYGYSPLYDIQLLCPSRKGETGTMNMNRILQEILNPKSRTKKEMMHNGYVLREGDKVMQVKNNYDVPWEKDDGETGAGVYNGDIGILMSVDIHSGIICVRYDDKVAVYSNESAGELELAYAMTVHKSQGSEFTAVIMPCIGIQPLLAYRNLLYTAVTRAKNMIVLVGNTQTLKSMVDNNRKVRRYSALDYFLELDKSDAIL